MPSSGLQRRPSDHLSRKGLRRKQSLIERAMCTPQLLSTPSGDGYSATPRMLAVSGCMKKSGASSLWSNPAAWTIVWLEGISQDVLEY